MGHVTLRIGSTFRKWEWEELLAFKRKKGGVAKSYIRPRTLDSLRDYDNQQSFLPQSVESHFLSPPPDTYYRLNQIGIYWSCIPSSGLLQYNMSLSASCPKFYTVSLCFSIYFVPIIHFCLITVISALIVIFLLMKLTFYSKQSVSQWQSISSFYFFAVVFIFFFLACEADKNLCL